MSLVGVDCIGYERVSTTQQAGEAQTSLADQRAAIHHLAAKLGVVVQAWYTDDGASGATVEQRPALRRLLADCAAHPRKKPGYVLVLNDSRFGRFPDPEDSAYWRVHLKKLGWRVQFAENDESTNPQLRTVMRAIVATQATQKREDVRANAKRGSRGTASQGYWATRAPYGYRRVVVYPPGRERVLATGQPKAPDEKISLSVHEDEAAVVRELFARYATGQHSLASLIQWLREIVPERKWTRAAIRYTLSSPAYVGDVVSGRASGDPAERREQAKRPESEWVTARDAHPALVSRALFADVQAVLGRNQKWTSRVRTDWILSGIVRCPCGQHYAAGGGNQIKRQDAMTSSYRCVSRGSVERCAYPGTVKKEWLERAALDVLARFIGTTSQRRTLRRLVDAGLREDTTEPTTASLAKQLTDATTTRDRLVKAVGDGTLTGDEAKERLNTIRRTIARLEAQHHAAENATETTQTIEAERERVLALAMDFRAAVKTLSGPALRELIRPWIQSATFDPRTRELTMDIRHIPATGYGDLNESPWPTAQEHTRTTTRRVRVVGGR